MRHIFFPVSQLKDVPYSYTVKLDDTKVRAELFEYHEMVTSSTALRIAKLLLYVLMYNQTTSYSVVLHSTQVELDMNVFLKWFQKIMLEASNIYWFEYQML